MIRPHCLIILAAVVAIGVPAQAADYSGRRPAAGRFLARCEDLGQLCFVESCGRDQIEAALGCRTTCPSSEVLEVVPASCPVLSGAPVLRRKG